MKKKSLSYFPNWEALTKLLTIMKISTLLLFICAFSVSATVPLKAQKLTLNLENVTMRQIFDEIEKQTGFKFFYVDEQVDVNRTLNLALNDRPVEEVLNDLFDKTQIQYKVFEDKLVVLWPNMVQQNKVTGKITDAATGEPLAGVNILIKGTSTGVVSDVNGNYSINLPEPNATLVFSYIGFNPEEIVVEGRSTLDVSLAQDITSLEEVVVVGYGTKKRSDITGSVAVMSADNLVDRPITRVDQALVGELAGVRVKQTSGMPGKGFSIQVRGKGSITANNEPLYVIDGFPLDVSPQNSSGAFSFGNPLDNINSNDIESIQVLKDASSTAIYGSRGSNGVVLIKTKQGQEGKAKISLQLSTGWNETSKKLDVLSGEEWAERATEMINAAYLRADPGTQNRQVTDDQATRVANIGGFNTGQILDPRWAMPGHPGLTYLNWQDEAFRKGPVNNVQMSATGGNNIVKYYISGDYLDQTGYIIGVNYKRYAARSNVEMKASDKLTVGLNLAPSYAIGNDPGVEGKDQQMHMLAGLTPVTEDTVGLYYNTGSYPQYRWGGSRQSPIMTLKYTTGLNKEFRTLATVYADYAIIKGLNFKTTFNLDNVNYSRKSYKPAWVSGNVGVRQATGGYSGYHRVTFVNENTLTFNRSFGGMHNVTALAGVSYHQNSINSFNMNSAAGFKTDYITTLNDAAAAPVTGITITGSTSETKNVLLSYFGRLEYSFKDKYLLSAIVRRDGSSRFGDNTKWGLFPSVSAGWKVSEESFMDNVEVINFLKIRASWGISGNEAAGEDYGHIALLQSSVYSFNGALAPGQSSYNYPNRALSWEESESINVGLDFGALDNRITGSFDIYTKTNSKLLLKVPVPTASGFPEALTNIGEVKNKGWEVELTGRILTGRLQWTASANLSHNTNEIVKLGPSNAPILPISMDIQHSILTVGQPMNAIYVVQQDGILSQADIDAGDPMYNTETAGDPKYVDQITVDTDGDGKPDAKDGRITPDDRVICGHPDPDYVWGISNTFTYKNFDLNVLVQGQWGGSVYSLFGRAMNRTGTGVPDNVLGGWRDRWRSEADPGAGKIGKTTGTFGRIKNTDWLYPNDYWRIRNITLGYNIGSIAKLPVVSGARIFVTAENWFGGDKYDGGWNPESINTNGGGGEYGGDDYGAAPLPRSVIFGINLNF
jgi:TonB-linked SusC/RagA family outer membrane protein